MQNNMMKKEYKVPRIKVWVMSCNLLDETSTIVVPGGGSGTPDGSRRSYEIWDDEDEEL